MGLELRVPGRPQRRKGTSMIRIREISLPPEHSVHQLSYEAARLLKISNSKVRRLNIVACRVKWATENAPMQLDFFADPREMEFLEKEKFKLRYGKESD